MKYINKMDRRGGRPLSSIFTDRTDSQTDRQKSKKNEKDKKRKEKYN